MLTVSSDVIDKIIKIVKDGGGKVFEDEGYINFCGVRNNVTNDSFNDTLYIYWKENGVFKCVKTKGFTTKPGKSSVLNTNGEGNVKGVAIVKEGWHQDIWHHGTHGIGSKNAHKALRQDEGITNPITITRDNTQYGTNKKNYELRIFSDTTEVGYPYTNMHRAGDSQGNTVNGWSAGCQVFKYKSEFDEMLNMANYATTKGQKKFSYYLTNEDVFNRSGVEDNNKSTAFNFEQSQFSETMKSGSKTDTSKYSNDVSNLGYSNSGEDSKTNSYGRVETSTSFGNKVIFGEVFPNDDNNRYIEMPSEDIAVVQYSEPN
jgi:hypothetical protein